MKRIIYLVTIVFIINIVLYSCDFLTNSLNHVYPGKAEIVKVEIDKQLNDSVMIYGEVYNAFGNHLYKGYNRIFKIYTENNLFVTEADTNAFFQMKISAGEHNITCEGENEDNSEHMCKLNLTTKPNQKIKLKFLYGETVW